MLPSLCRLCIITDGSRRESDIEELLIGGLISPPNTSDVLLWYASSTALRFRFLRKMNKPPAMAQIATTPTTTPAAMPAVLGPFDFFSVSTAGGAALVWPGAVTTTVLARVIVEGGSFLVESGSALGGAAAVGLLFAAAVGDADFTADADDDSAVFGFLLVLESESDPESEPV